MDHLGRLWLLKTKSHSIMFGSPALRAFVDWQNNFFSWYNSNISLHYTVLHQSRDPLVQRRSKGTCAGIERGKSLIIWLHTISWYIYTNLHRQHNPDMFLNCNFIFLHYQVWFYLLWMEYSIKGFFNDRRIGNSSLKHTLVYIWTAE